MDWLTVVTAAIPVVTGATFIAYKHPTAYAKFLIPLLTAVTVICMTFIAGLKFVSLWAEEAALTHLNILSSHLTVTR